MSASPQTTPAPALARLMLQGKTAVVTGAAGGIGRALSETLGQLGAKVVLADLSPNVHVVARELADAGLATDAVVFDVTDGAQVREVARALEARHGRIDIFVANAGMTNEFATLDHSDADWHKMIAINLDSVFYTVKEFGRGMVAAGGGAIVAISSIAGVKKVRPEVHIGYDVAKAGVAHLCKVLGCEWAGTGVRVNAVGPGYTDTKMLADVGRSKPEVLKVWLDDTPNKRLVTPQEIASTVAFLVSDAASGITGQLLMCDGGYSVS